MEKNDDISEKTNLRLKAEEILKIKSSLIIEHPNRHSEADIYKLNHELEVYQIELEMQNEELLHAKDAATENLEKYIEIYDFAPSGYFTLTPNCEIIELNFKAAAMLGKNRHLLQYKSLGLFVSPDTKATFTEFIKNIFEGSKPDTCEISFKVDNNEPLYVSLTGILSKSGKKCFLTALDLTDRKQAEVVRQQIEELKEMYASKDKLFSIIAHDLRTPFNSILGYSELLIENAKTIQDEEIAVFSEIINSSANNTLHLLDNLLNWAKTQTGQISFDLEKINLSDVINELIEIFNPTAKFKNISITFAQANKFEFYADRNMLFTILRNLINNAIKFTSVNGKIEINAKKQKDSILISVSDNGVGMDQNILDQLFKPNEGLITPGTVKEHGSGLGLLICKEFVEKHGGTVGVESKPGKGSIFHFTLPHFF